MAKDAPSSSKAPPHKKQAGEITRGKSHTQLLTQRTSLKKELKSLPSDQRSKVLSHFHGSERNDLSQARLRNLKQDDRNRDTSNLSAYQIKNLDKRRAKPNMALQRQMHRRETKRLENAMSAADAEEILHTHTAGLIEVETDMEKTIQLSQRTLKHEHLEENAARNIYDLDLNEYGPYKMRYDRSGRWSLLAGKTGHVSIIDQHSLALKTEFFVQDSIRDACFLHSGSMMAVSQEKNVFIYDEEGTEIHRLDGHRRVTGMEFLPYHWLLGKKRCVYALFIVCS
mmetsp:Transcript_22220/g.48280  ORF Transcript_22220/g.48280 Transcript_22220/m.48280 type:complete len:283 (-) Transcript_22220:1218-2066(-)